MPEAWERGVERRAKWIAKQKPKYVLDHRIKYHEALKKGVDCSMFDFLAHHLEGVPGIERCSAEDMRHGRFGWAGRDLPDGLRSAGRCDIPYWIWTPKPGKPKSKRIQHTGLLVMDEESGYPAVYHASSSQGTVVKAEMRGVLERDLVVIRHTTIGEPIRKTK